MFAGQAKRVLLHIPDVRHVLSVSYERWNAWPLPTQIKMWACSSPRQGELLELPAHHLPHPLLLRDVPHPGLQLPTQQQLQEQNILQAAEVSTIYLYLSIHYLLRISGRRYVAEQDLCMCMNHDI